MNKKIFISGLSILSALALVGGATFAFFSSSASSTGNLFSSGSLVLKLDDNNEATSSAITASLGGSNLVPGATVSGFISLENTGTTDMAKVKIGATETATSSPDLASVLDMDVKVGNDNVCTAGTDVTSSMLASLGVGAPLTLAKLNAHAPITLFSGSPALAAGATKFMCASFTMESSADNSFQSKSITDSFTFEGDQDSSQ